MKEIIMKNFSLKILAILLGVAVWLIVNNIDDPVSTKVIKNVEVTLQNEGAIREQNQVFEVKSGGEINVTVKSKRSILNRISKENIVAVADLSQLSITKAVAIQLSCNNSDYVTLSSDVTMLTISTEEEATGRFPIKVNPVGELAAGYALGTIKTSPNLVRVTGGESQIERIAEVRVDVDVEGATEKVVAVVQPKAYDANGKVMDSTALSFSGNNKVKVEVQVNATKEVPISVQTKGTPSMGYHVLAVEYEPQTVVITGECDALKKCNSIPITYDVTNSSKNIYETLDLNSWLPSGISVVDSSATSISLQITISKQSLQSVNLPITDIEIRNLDKDKYDITFTGNGYVLLNAIWSKDGQESTITASDIEAYIDCDELTEGRHTVKLQFAKNDDVLVENEVEVEVIIQNKEKEEEVTTTEPTKKPEETKQPEEENVEETKQPEEDDAEAVG